MSSFKKILTFYNENMRTLSEALKESGASKTFLFDEADTMSAQDLLEILAANQIDLHAEFKGARAETLINQPKRK